MRLIDADDFKEKIKGVCDAGGWLEPVTTAIKEYICKQVDYQTTVDAVEVVRCKDCKYFDGECCDRYADETLGYSHSTQPNFFCACGERKINDSQMQSDKIRQK